MQTVIPWHPWPEEKPPEEGEEYILSKLDRNGHQYITMDNWYRHGEGWIHVRDTVIAWAYPIAPYDPNAGVAQKEPVKAECTGSGPAPGDQCGWEPCPWRVCGTCKHWIPDKYDRITEPGCDGKCGLHNIGSGKLASTYYMFPCNLIPGPNAEWSSNFHPDRKVDYWEPK